jgi:hypothetical protein
MYHREMHVTSSTGIWLLFPSYPSSLLTIKKCIYNRFRVQLRLFLLSSSVTMFSICIYIYLYFLATLWPFLGSGDSEWSMLCTATTLRKWLSRASYEVGGWYSSRVSRKCNSATECYRTYRILVLCSNEKSQVYLQPLSWTVHGNSPCILCLWYTITGREWCGESDRAMSETVFTGFVIFIIQSRFQ